jgi:hypothetical protein
MSFTNCAGARQMRDDPTGRAADLPSLLPIARS